MERIIGRKELELKSQTAKQMIQTMNEKYGVDKLTNDQFFYGTEDLKSDEIALKLMRTTNGNAERGWVPAYHFRICGVDGTEYGVCDLRIGDNENTYYGGNIGYEVYEPFRGHHYAGKACQLMFQQARKHGMDHLIITCNPDNTASSHTCMWLGGELLEVVDLPEDNDMYQEGERQKNIYRFDLRNC